MCFCTDKNDLAQHMAGGKTIATPVLEVQTMADVSKISICQKSEKERHCQSSQNQKRRICYFNFITKHKQGAGTSKQIIINTSSHNFLRHFGRKLPFQFVVLAIFSKSASG